MKWAAALSAQMMFSGLGPVARSAGWKFNDDVCPGVALAQARSTPGFMLSPASQANYIPAPQVSDQTCFAG